MDDLAPVLTPDFYQAAGYYFEGVWTNVTEAERQLLRLLAGRAEGSWTPAELAAATGQTESAIRAALDLLRRHDVVVDEAGGVRFAAELMRRWVAEYGGDRTTNRAGLTESRGGKWLAAPIRFDKSLGFVVLCVMGGAV